MNQPTTPNTVEDFLPLPETRYALAIDGAGYVPGMKGYTADQVRAAILADRAQRPTVAGSVDTPEFTDLLYQYSVAFAKEAEKDESYAESNAKRDLLIAHINARLAPAAPSGEAVAIVTGSSVQWLPGAGKVADRTPLYTHPAPSSPTAPGLPAQAVPELAKWIDDAKGKDPFTDDLIAEIEQLRAQVAANKQEGK